MGLFCLSGKYSFCTPQRSLFIHYPDKTGVTPVDFLIFQILDARLPPQLPICQTSLHHVQTKRAAAAEKPAVTAHMHRFSIYFVPAAPPPALCRSDGRQQSLPGRSPLRKAQWAPPEGSSPPEQRRYAPTLVLQAPVPEGPSTPLSGNSVLWAGSAPWVPVFSEEPVPPPTPLPQPKEQLLHSEAWSSAPESPHRRTHTPYLPGATVLPAHDRSSPGAPAESAAADRLVLSPSPAAPNER